MNSSHNNRRIAQNTTAWGLSKAAGTALLLAALWSATASASAEIAGKVVAVLDGDTIDVLVDRRPIRVRLAEIDAPEKKQPWGARSRQALAGFVAGQLVTVREDGTDRYKRTIGTVYIDGKSVNRAMVGAGMAWTYRQYLRDRTLLDVEAAARTSGRGLWADANPVAPWAWRAAQRAGVRSAPEMKQP